MNFKINISLFFIAVISNTQLHAQDEKINSDVEWAWKITEVSSEYSDKEKSANQLLGKPNAMPAGGTSPCAWAVKEKRGKELSGQAFIKVAFKNPIKAQQLVIAESFNPGSIEKIVLYGKEKGDEKIVYEVIPNTVNKESRMLNVFFESISFNVTEGAIFLQPDKIPGRNEIDAFGISVSKDTVKAVINIADTLCCSIKKENLGAAINTEYNEIDPKISPDGRLLYFDRKNHPLNICNINDDDDIWVSVLSKDSVWSPATNIGPPLNDCNNNFVQSITPDGNTLLLGNVYNWNGTADNGVSLSDKTTDGWGNPQEQHINGFYNKNKYVNYFLSNDKKHLLMAIETTNGFGGLDLYVSFYLEKNKWSAPRNLGNLINTAANDFSPFLAADGVTLYYATSGISGYGKEDIFITKRIDDTWEKWSEPQNLGVSINTKGSDSKYTIPASSDFAYFSSTDNSVGLNDIFRIKLPVALKPKPVVMVKGKVMDDKTGKPVSAEIIYETIPDGKEIGRAHTDPNTGEYTIVLPVGYNYSFRAVADDFIGISSNVNLIDAKEYAVVEQAVLKLTSVVIGATVTLNNIFFEYAKSELLQTSFAELNHILDFLKQTPKIEIELGGHTDNVGSDIANDKLSKDRAQAVADYLADNGIKKERISVVGYGKKRPVADNDSEENRAKNRRVEFTIINK